MHHHYTQPIRELSVRLALKVGQGEGTIKRNRKEKKKRNHKPRIQSRPFTVSVGTPQAHHRVQIWREHQIYMRKHPADQEAVSSCAVSRKWNRSPAYAPEIAVPKLGGFGQKHSTRFSPSQRPQTQRATGKPRLVLGSHCNKHMP